MDGRGYLHTSVQITTHMSLLTRQDFPTKYSILSYMHANPRVTDAYYLPPGGSPEREIMKCSLCVRACVRASVRPCVRACVRASVSVSR